jgi:hypothetical protein
MTTGREGAPATLLGNGRVLLAGGGNPSGLASAEPYDPNSRSWSATGRMTAGPLVDPNMQGSAAALLPNGQVPDAGGYSVVCGVENCDYRPPPAPSCTRPGPEAQAQSCSRKAKAAENGALSLLFRPAQARSDTVGQTPVRREIEMARRSVLVSDLSGSEIRDEKDSAQVVIKYGDARRGQVTLDVLASEVDDLARKGRKTARRGRKPKSETG